MKASRPPVEEWDVDPVATAYVDDEDYAIDCDRLDDIEIFAAGRSMRPVDPD